MAQRSGFFEAKVNEETNEYDRMYFAADFAKYFSLFVGNGVFAKEDTNLMVEAVSGMKIKVNPGWAFLEGYWYENPEEDEYVIDVPVNTTATARTDVIVVRRDTALRDTYLAYLEGEATIRRDGSYFDLMLAKITVPVGAASITNANITDTRSDENVCGFVKGLVDVITSDKLFKQFTAQFNEWFAGVQDRVANSVTAELNDSVFTTLEEFVIATATDVDNPHVFRFVDSGGWGPLKEPGQVYKCAVVYSNPYEEGSETDVNGSAIFWSTDGNMYNVLISGIKDESNITINSKRVMTETEYDELKKFVSDGKEEVAAAITEKGVPTAATDEFKIMANNIRLIASGGAGSDVEYIAEQYSEGKTYYEGDYVIHEDQLYECLEDNVEGPFDASKWEPTYLSEVASKYLEVISTASRTVIGTFNGSGSTTVTSHTITVPKGRTAVNLSLMTFSSSFISVSSIDGAIPIVVDDSLDEITKQYSIGGNAISLSDYMYVFDLEEQVEVTFNFSAACVGSCSIANGVSSKVNGNLGEEPVLLWTNSNVNATFAAQTIELDLTDYEAVIIHYRRVNTASYTDTTYQYAKKNFSTQYYNSGPGSFAGGALSARNLTSVTDAGITFDSGRSGSSSISQNDGVMIPWHIYGVKSNSNLDIVTVGAITKGTTINCNIGDLIAIFVTDILEFTTLIKSGAESLQMSTNISAIGHYGYMEIARATSEVVTLNSAYSRYSVISI